RVRDAVLRGDHDDEPFVRILAEPRGNERGRPLVCRTVRQDRAANFDNGDTRGSLVKRAHATPRASGYSLCRTGSPRRAPLAHARAARVGTATSGGNTQRLAQ